jgi:hypothetical protein
MLIGLWAIRSRMASLAMVRILLVGETTEPCPERTLERYWTVFAEKPWAGTVNEIEWRKHGFEGSRLAYLQGRWPNLVLRKAAAQVSLNLTLRRST